jgi:hypothetical protein
MKMAPDLAEYVIYLPLCYNDGSKIEEEKIAITINEILEKFGALTRQKASEGIWIYKNRSYCDQIDKIEILIENTRENDKWFENFKKVLEKRFKQEEIFVKKIKGMERL